MLLPGTVEQVQSTRGNNGKSGTDKQENNNHDLFIIISVVQALNLIRSDGKWNSFCVELYKYLT